MGRLRGRGIAYRARIAVLIGAAVLAIALAMLEALAG
jgi:hypothetical protein